ncbi:hypothetical protein SNEBB_003973 [Seison nebaliae]|nr:hypothetical protein SNEBB_003973 [Seison nebaliae]
MKLWESELRKLNAEKQIIVVQKTIAKEVKEKTKLKERSECICCDREKTVLFFPCRHIVYCGDCYRRTSSTLYMENGRYEEFKKSQETDKVKPLSYRRYPIEPWRADDTTPISKLWKHKKHINCPRCWVKVESAVYLKE